MGKHLIFSFDFDCTISEDPNTFLILMDILRRSGHTVYVCTGRMKTTAPEELDFLKDEGYEVIFTEHTAKKKFMESLGINVDIWVDDCPEAVYEDWNGPIRTYRNKHEWKAA